MTERWGKCRFCKGTGLIKDPVLLREENCGHCGGQGYDGSIEELEREERRLDEDNRPNDKELGR